MLSVQLLHRKAGRGAGSAVLASSLPTPHCASSLHSNSSTLKMLGKWGWLLVRNVNVGSLHHFWPSQILLRFLREQFVSWLNSSLLQLHLLGNYTVLNCPSSFNLPRCYSLSCDAVECYSMLTSSCYVSPKKWLHGSGGWQPSLRVCASRACTRYWDWKMFWDSLGVSNAT